MSVFKQVERNGRNLAKLLTRSTGMNLTPEFDMAVRLEKRITNGQYMIIPRTAAITFLNDDNAGYTQFRPRDAMPELVKTELEKQDAENTVAYDQLQTGSEKEARLQEAVSAVFKSFVRSVGHTYADIIDTRAISRSMIQEHRANLSRNIEEFKEVFDIMAEHINSLVEDRKHGETRDALTTAKDAINSWQKDIVELSALLSNNAQGAAPALR